MNLHSASAFGVVRKTALLVALGALALTSSLDAAIFGSPSVFATGGAVNATQPDSITYGNGSIWVEYGNGAPSTNLTGSGTIVQYSLSGAVLNTYTIAGSVDGLKYNSATGQVWALENQDANSQLTIINPVTKTTSVFTYDSSYPSVSGSRGFDDVAFLNGNVYLSLTNPSSSSDPVLVKLDNSTPASPITFSSVLTGNGLLLTDPDSLKSTPTGGLVETGEGDKALTLINNVGLLTQTATSLQLVGSGANTIGNPDDAIFPTASSGTFYLTDTAANTVYALTATGLSTSSLYVNVGNEFGSVDLSTGIVTPIITGTSLHGLEFVPAATPEPASMALVFVGLAAVVLAGRKTLAR